MGGTRLGYTVLVIVNSACVIATDHHLRMVSIQGSTCIDIIDEPSLDLHLPAVSSASRDASWVHLVGVRLSDP